MGRWDDYRVRREHVIEGVILARRRQACASYMLVFAHMIVRMQKVSKHLEEHRELKRKQEREEARLAKLAQERAKAEEKSDDEEA